jgi:hypothetical protein
LAFYAFSSLFFLYLANFAFSLAADLATLVPITQSADSVTSGISQPFRWHQLQSLPQVQVEAQVTTIIALLSQSKEAGARE